MEGREIDKSLKNDNNYMWTLDDEVEQLRQMKLTQMKDRNIKGIPVTLESFNIWKEKKHKKKADDARRTVEAEICKKGDKGLSVLSGRDLFEYKPDLFMDDGLHSFMEDSTFTC